MNKLVLEEVLELAYQQNASDIHLTAGKPVVFRIDGELVENSTELRSMSELGSKVELKSFEPLLIRVASEKNEIGNVRIENNRIYCDITASEKIESATLIAGVYDTSGRLFGVAKAPVELSLGTTEDLFVDSLVETCGKTVKLMLWNEQFEPLSDYEVYNYKIPGV